MNNAAANPRAVVGDNRAKADYAQRVTDEMAASYAELIKNAEGLLNEARLLPSAVTKDEDVSLFAKVIVNLRDTAARALAFHKAEKEPFLRGGEAVDQFFFGLHDKLSRRRKADRPGAADVLQARVDAYQQQKLAEERRQRDEADRIAREAAAKAQREADELAAAAARARKQETIEAKKEEANAAAMAAADAAERAREASREAAAKSADLVRHRTDGGELVTMKQEPDVRITDEMKLNAIALWPFVKTDHKLQALKAWAKVTQHKQQMEGAVIAMRDVTVIR